MHIGDRLESLRTRAGLSARQLAILAEISESYPGLIESGARKDIGAEIAAKLCTVLGCSLDYLVRGVGDPPTPREIAVAVALAKAKHGPTEAA
jgi:transcriptional regulator with XRE-family HTH domain